MNISGKWKLTFLDFWPFPHPWETLAASLASPWTWSKRKVWKWCPIKWRFDSFSFSFCFCLIISLLYCQVFMFLVFFKSLFFVTLGCCPHCNFLFVFIFCPFFKKNIFVKYLLMSNITFFQMALYKLVCLMSRAGHFRYFLVFSIIKNDFFSFFIKSITYFCASPI